MGTHDPPGPTLTALRDHVRDELARGAETADYFSSRPTAELHAVLRETPTRTLASLINTGAVAIDVPARRIFRDVFWKGSFARDTLLGWEERVRTSVLGAAGVQAGAVHAGGAFWKRFDRVENGVATGHVVNYELAALPGKPVVEEVEYPDGDRPYFKKGDRVLLLRYTNHPYRLVYDTIKVIDERNAIGVMHLGDFPRGLEFAAFVLARHNYPFDHMSIEDHRLLFEHPQAAPPAAPHLSRTWSGRLVLLARADSILVTAVNPVTLHLTFRDAGSAIEAACRFGPVVDGGTTEMTEAQIRRATLAEWQQELRLVGTDTLVGTWTVSTPTAKLLGPLERFLEGNRDRASCYFVAAPA